MNTPCTQTSFHHIHFEFRTLNVLYDRHSSKPRLTGRYIASFVFLYKMRFIGLHESENVLSGTTCYRRLYSAIKLNELKLLGTVFV
jgi:hypothetical protein